MSSLQIPLPVSFPRAPSPAPAIPGAWPTTPHNRFAADSSFSMSISSSTSRSLAEAQSSDSVQTSDSTLAPEDESPLWSKFDTSSTLASSATNSSQGPLFRHDHKKESLQVSPFTPVKCTAAVAQGSDFSELQMTSSPSIRYRSSPPKRISIPPSLELSRLSPNEFASTRNCTTTSQSQASPTSVPSPTTPVTPTSPMIFASPPSQQACPFSSPEQNLDTTCSSSYEDHSLDTSYGSEIIDGTIASLARRIDRPPLSIETNESDNLISDVEYDASTEARTRDLSSSPDTSDHVPLAHTLGNTVPTDVGSTDRSLRSSLELRSQEAPAQQWTLSLSGASLGYSDSEAFAAARSPNYGTMSLSPASSYGVEIDTDALGAGHAIILPRQNFSPTSSSFSSPIIEHRVALTEANVLGLSEASSSELRDTGAAEYAAAVVSSAWGSDGHDGSGHSSALGLHLDARDTTLHRVQEDGLRAHDAVETEESGVSSVRITDLVDIEFHAPPKRGVLQKVINYGAQMKNFLTTKKKKVQGGRHSFHHEDHYVPSLWQEPLAQRSPAPRDSQSEAIRDDRNVVPLPNIEESSSHINMHIPPPLIPPGLHPLVQSPSNKRKTGATYGSPRPSVRAQTVALPPPVIRVSSPSPSESVPPVNLDYQCKDLRHRQCSKEVQLRRYQTRCQPILPAPFQSQHVQVIYSVHGASGEPTLYHSKQTERTPSFFTVYRIKPFSGSPAFLTIAYI
ncbi:hypothetical protein PLEOSDRAFT_166150 [Pleurotus ostreatus PC15]|uniref:Uncharacterized protein n=1 Tax=Pleurotus ostreatus (strain PC15) TaxID=1137138 RepID=A0A067NS25_PLEO1|nr:hypothetical protein PLEOSDRAFT_166150 [Pleurotus ostreatus PC15]